MKSILIIEDDKGLSEGISLSLADSDRDFVRVFDLKSGWEAVKKRRFNLIILDVNLPDGNGFDFCKKFRLEDDTPILFLTANDMEMDVVRGLEIGGNDYVTKPFSLGILRARVSLLLKSSNRKSELIEIGKYRFNFDRMEFYKDGEEIQLSKVEQKLLKVLVENRGISLSREKIIDRVWGGEFEYVDENSLSVSIKRLRGKLEDKTYIKTIYGIGYSWVVER